MTAALKEWGAAIHAMLDGRQTVLLRKGGIHEKRFTVNSSRFLLYPTYAHTHAGSTRPEHHDLLARGSADATDDSLTIRAAAEVVAAIPLAHPELIDRLEPFHIWTTESVRQNRLDFRPRHQLTVLIVRAVPLQAPVVIPRLAQYAGCTSWVELPIELPHQETPSDGLTELAARLRELVTTQ